MLIAFFLDLPFFVVVIFHCIGVLAKQGQHNRFSCSTNIPALKKAELDRCVAAEGMNIEKILITNHLPIKVSEERVGKLAFIANSMLSSIGVAPASHDHIRCRVRD